MRNRVRLPEKFNRGLHIWIIAIIMDLFIVVYNSNFINIASWFPWSEEFVTAHGASLLVLSFIFLIPIVYASIIFGLRGTLLTWFVFLIGSLPRQIVETHSLEDGLRFGLFALVALLLGLLISLARSAAMQEKALVRQLEPRRWNSIGRILRVQENERKRLARELHDDTIQDLLVVVNHLHALEAGVHGDLPHRTKDRVEGVETELLKVIDKMRKMSQGLRAGVLDNTGLVPALKWLTEGITQDTGIHVTLTITGKQHKIKPEAEMLLFRIAQEALNNVKQHSKATWVRVNLDFAARDIALTVQDNGIGFVPPSGAGEGATGQLGLDVMRQRAKLLGGRLDVKSELGIGTTINVEARL